MLRLARRFVAATIAALAMATAPAARAQAPDIAAAQALLEDGNRAAAAGDFAAALERFQAAYARYASPSILLNIGTTLRRLGRNPEAAVVYERYLRDPSVPPEKATEVRRALGEIDAAVARVTIGATDMDAHVWIDGGELRGFALGSTVRLTPGRHTVAAGRGAPQASEMIQVQAGEVRSVYLRLAAAPPSIVAPPVPPPPMMVVVNEPEERPAPRRRNRSMGPLRATGLVLDIVGGIGLAGSLGAGITAFVMDRDASSHCLGGGAACEPRALELQSQSRTAARASLVLLGVSGGLLIVGGVLQAVDRGARSDDAHTTSLPRVAFAPTAGGGFVTVETAW